MVMSIMVIMWMAWMSSVLGSSVIMPTRLNTEIQLCNGFIVFFRTDSSIAIKQEMKKKLL